MSAQMHRIGTPARVRLTIVATASAMLVVALLLAGCGGDDGTGSASSSAGVSTSEASTTSVAASSTTPPTTVVVSAMVFASPKAAADLLFAAWTSGDRTAADAAHWALPAELDKLFAAGVIATPKNRGCDDGLGGMSQCFVANGNGGIDIDLVAGAGGWTVQTITPFAGG